MHIDILGDVTWVSRSRILGKSQSKIAIFFGKSGNQEKIENFGENREKVIPTSFYHHNEHFGQVS